MNTQQDSLPEDMNAIHVALKTTTHDASTEELSNIHNRKYLKFTRAVLEQWG